MIHFAHSTFTWKHHPMERHPYYKYPGGFVGNPGDAYHVRFDLDCLCRILKRNGEPYEIFLGADCRSEYTIAKRNLFQVPSSEFRMAFTRSMRIHIARHPSLEEDDFQNAPLNESFQDYNIKLNRFSPFDRITDGKRCVEATLSNAVLNARTRWLDPERNVEIELEYPVRLINLDEARGEFQVCTGPVIVPDLETWDGEAMGRVYLAHAAFSSFDWVEFIFRREVQASASDREWLEEIHGRDRWDPHDPEKLPPDNIAGAGKRPLLTGLTAYHEIMELSCRNEVLSAL